VSGRSPRVLSPRRAQLHLSRCVRVRITHRSPRTITRGQAATGRSQREYSIPRRGLSAATTEMIYQPRAVTPPAPSPSPARRMLHSGGKSLREVCRGGARSRIIIRDSRRSLGNARQADRMLADWQYGRKYSRPLILRRPRRIIESRRLPFLTIRSPNNNTFVQRESGDVADDVCCFSVSRYRITRRG